MTSSRYAVFQLILVSLAVVSCGSGGGSGGVTVPPSTLPPPPPIVTGTCAAQMLYWKSGSAFCGAQASETPVGQSSFIQDLTGTTGAALFACSGGTWTPSNTPTCSNPAISIDATITNVRVASTSGSAQANVPITFGHVFAQGHLMPNQSISGSLPGGVSVPLQIDVKATHTDGSIRHSIVSGVIPSLPAGQTVNLDLGKRALVPNNTAAVTPASLLANGFSANVTLNVSGTNYSASVGNLMAGVPDRTWLSGPYANEWHFSTPLKNAGTPHPHLSARFAIRAYSNNVASVDVTVENTWAYELNPQNYIYDVAVDVGGTPAFSVTALNHFHHSRWRRVFWWGTKPEVDVKLNSTYLMATGAVPNYDPETIPSESGLAALYSKWNAANNGLMRNSILEPYFPSTGGRPDIAPLPQWAALHVISMDKRAKEVTLAVGETAGHFPIHWRDKNTGYPLSVEDYPYTGLLGSSIDHTPPSGGSSQKLPVCPFGASDSRCEASWTSGATKITLVPDESHQPSMSYYPYLISGDYFFLEELHFWANYNVIPPTPSSRGFDKGLLPWQQVRGQAWSLRTFSNSAYITPDTHPYKNYFVRMVKNNLSWYNLAYSDNLSANSLGFISGKSGLIPFEFDPMGYPIKNIASRGIAPWMDDFFTWTVGDIIESGVGDSALKQDAIKLLAWKSKFPLGRMTAPNVCWSDASYYSAAVRDGGSGTPFYTTFEQLWRASAPSLDGSVIPETNSKGNYFSSAVVCGTQSQADWRTQTRIDQGLGFDVWGVRDMVGYRLTPEGTPSILQAALATAAHSGLPDSATAWRLLITRTGKPNYSAFPQWSIVPRN